MHESSPYELGSNEHTAWIWLHRDNPGLGFASHHQIHTLVQNELYALTHYPFKSTTSEFMSLLGNLKSTDEYFIQAFINVLFDNVNYPSYDTDGNTFYASFALTHKSKQSPERQETIVLEHNSDDYISLTYYPEGITINNGVVYAATEKSAHAITFWNSNLTNGAFLQFANVDPTGKIDRIILTPVKPFEVEDIVPILKLHKHRS